MEIRCTSVRISFSLSLRRPNDAREPFERDTTTGVFIWNKKTFTKKIPSKYFVQSGGGVGFDNRFFRCYAGA